jgi:DNA-binding NarL/FixJ family response regulator
MALRTVLVDDIDEMRDLLRMLLRRDGRFTIVGEAGNGQEALDVVAELRPDVVVLDIGMPALDGVSALPRLRASSPATQIVMLSAYPAAEMERRAVEGGAIGYVEKRSSLEDFPAQLHALVSVLETVQHVLDGRYGTEVTSPGAARRDLRAALASKAEPTVVELVELLSSELVTNAVHHARSDARVTAAVIGSRVRVSVSDDGPGLPVAGPSTAEAMSGRGLHLVDALSAAWGVDPGDPGKTIWFELELADPGSGR